jgi:LmbE family N-acetylglucosaminyl deacetylase
VRQRARQRRRRAWVAGLAVAALAGLVPVGPATATEVPSGGILIIAAHPDDDVITAAGIADAASGHATIAYITNGDYCEPPIPVDTSRYDYCGEGTPDIGTTRQGEAVTAQDRLGQAESDLVFLGYPDGFLWNLGDANRSETYATRGLGGMDWHAYRDDVAPIHEHAAYTEENLAADIQDLIDYFRPTDIYTHSRYDRHNDHRKVYEEVVAAVAAIPGYSPYIHTTIVHVGNQAYWGSWPDPADQSTPINVYPELESDTGGELVWERRESYPVPDTAKKASAVFDHASQVNLDGGFIQRFIHSDEVFWKERIGSPEGEDDAITVAEGQTVVIPEATVLRNDVHGTDTSPLGAMTVSLVSGPDTAHGTVSFDSTNHRFIYTHDGSETTSDSFAYRPVQGAADGSIATVNITVDPVDDPPVAVADGPYHVERRDTLTVTGAGVLGNDSDPDDNSLTAVLVDDVTHGTLQLNPNGSFTYSNDGSAATSDSFTYRAKDPSGAESGTALVSLVIDPAPIVAQPDVAVIGPATGAVGVPVEFTAQVSGGSGPVTYEWSASQDGMEVATSNGDSLAVTPGASGGYEIQVAVTDDTGTVVATAAFSAIGDIAGSTFSADIIWLADEGITKGCNPPANDMFCPNAFVTRGQMAAFLARFLGLTVVDPGVGFVDTGASVFEADILKLATAGITKGCNPPANDMFCPNAFVTRGQMAAFLVRAVGLTVVDPGVGFVDTGASVFEADILKLATAGITKGCNPPANDMFCPAGAVTRGQMAAFLHRASDLVGP